MQLIPPFTVSKPDDNCVSAFVRSPLCVSPTIERDFRNNSTRRNLVKLRFLQFFRDVPSRPHRGLFTRKVKSCQIYNRLLQFDSTFIIVLFL